MESGFKETVTREIGFPYSADTFIRFKRWLESKSSSSSSRTSTLTSHSEQSDDATSNSSSSGANTPPQTKEESSGSHSPEESSARSSGSSGSSGSTGSNSSSAGLIMLKELLDCADQYLESELLARVGEQILTRPLSQLSDFALTYSLAFSLDRQMPERAAFAKQQCLDVLVQELMRGMPYLTCDKCADAVEHYNYPVATKVPACRCDTCACFRHHYDSSIPPQVVPSCACKTQLVARICMQRQCVHGLPVHSPALSAAFLELAEMGEVAPLAALASITETLVPFFDPRFVEALSQPQMLHLLDNTVSAHRNVTSELVEALRAKGFHEAVTRAAQIIAKR
jgi:hypothetical protein